VRIVRWGPARGQVLLVFAVALPALFGFLGLALDGGYFFAASEDAQFAARAAARSAAVAVQSGSYGAATTNGQAIGQRNLSELRLTGVSVALAYHNTAGAAPTAAGWGTTPTAQTRAVRATVSGTYRTLFLPLVGVSSASIQRVTVVSMGTSLVLPLAVCSSVVAAQPSGAWVIWQDQASLCGVSSWDGLVNLDGSATSCTPYQNWISPAPPRGPAPVDGSTLTLDTRRCNQVDVWLRAYPSGSLVQPIVVVDVVGGRRVLGCRRVALDLSTSNTVRASPTAALEPCLSLRETY
jgi:Flp pilus assembly protein TadG